ncbi:MAG: TetR/AcrR family transcriptional regulator [Alphaproteobacteria bacterium]|nr:TetR/AcrR family transcriptional regulator [Alphaproteobacteria bacterium]
MSNPAPRPSGPSPLRARERILNAAAELFRAQGYEASMDAIATAAGVSKQTLYNQFGSKEELFKAIIAARADVLRAPLSAAGPERHPREVLTGFARQYYTLFLTPDGMDFLRMLIAAAPRFPELAQDFYDLGPKRTLSLLTEWMAREDRLGRLDTGDPALAAEHFSSLILGHFQLRGLLGMASALSPSEIERRARFCADAFMRAFGP